MNPPLLTDHGVGDTTDADGDHPLLDLRRALWHRHARCTDQVDLFFAPDAEQPEERRRRERLALDLCGACPVRSTCRDTGRSNREIGVWGGETDEERAAGGHAPRNLSRRSVIRAARTGRVASVDMS